MRKRLLLQIALSAVLVNCGGGNDETSRSHEPARLIGEIFGSTAHLASAEIVSNIGYSGNLNNLETSRAIQKAGKANMLDFLFLFPNLVIAKSGVEGIPANRVSDAFKVADLSWS